ncbi:MAG: M15 family metallopeptidase [Bacteroidetes bacterium]|nr:M15 family metallopeptidase [Bacteroidota bacterium]
MKSLAALLLFLSLSPLVVQAQSGSDELVNIKELIHDIVIDVRYNTTDNFVTKYSGAPQKLYTTDECLVSRAAAERLIVIQDSLRKRGLGLKMYDGYRPRSVQYFMYETLPVEYRAYLANPDQGSHHNRGAAVDVSLVDLATGKELAMPTAFDYFGPEAGHDYTHPDPQVNQNRILLRSMMLDVGKFTEYVVEWWHYQLPAATGFPLVDYQLK